MASLHNILHNAHTYPSQLHKSEGKYMSKDGDSCLKDKKPDVEIEKK